MLSFFCHAQADDGALLQFRRILMVISDSDAKTTHVPRERSGPAILEPIAQHLHNLSNR